MRGRRLGRQRAVDGELALAVLAGLDAPAAVDDHRAGDRTGSAEGRRVRCSHETETVLESGQRAVDVQLSAGDGRRARIAVRAGEDDGAVGTGLAEAVEVHGDSRRAGVAFHGGRIAHDDRRRCR